MYLLGNWNGSYFGCKNNLLNKISEYHFDDAFKKIIGKSPKYVRNIILTSQYVKLQQNLRTPIILRIYQINWEGPRTTRLSEQGSDKHRLRGGFGRGSIRGEARLFWSVWAEDGRHTKTTTDPHTNSKEIDSAPTQYALSCRPHHVPR